MDSLEVNAKEGRYHHPELSRSPLQWWLLQAVSGGRLCHFLPPGSHSPSKLEAAGEDPDTALLCRGT